MSIPTLSLPIIRFNLDILCQKLIDKIGAAKLDIESLAQLVKLCQSALEQTPHERISISTKHKLCIGLCTCFFLFLEHEAYRYPRVCIKCMALLKRGTVASHIICRALLERSLVYRHLFNKDFTDRTTNISEDFSSLSKENLKVTLGHRFRRLPNQPENHHINRRKKPQLDQEDLRTPSRTSVNSYLLLEAFKASIDSYEEFAALFIEFHCPVMFDKLVWPNDESLRVINERSLGILKKFEQIPPFWDLYELLGREGCLKNCLVLVKSLLSALLALWASATNNTYKDRMKSTSRLIPPLAQSGLVPLAFGHAVEALPHLEPSEVFSVLSDIWHYLKDTNLNTNTNIEDELTRAKPYLRRLRLFMCQHIPGPLYVKIFKDFYTPIRQK